MRRATDGLEGLSDTQRQALESLLLDFDQSWGPGALANRAREFPSDDEHFRRVALLELVKMDVERQWKSGNHRNIEEYLKQFPALGTPDTVEPELLLAEYEARRQIRAPAALRDFQLRFPQRFEALRRLLERQGSSSSVPSTGGDTSQSGRVSETKVEGVNSFSELPKELGRYRILRRLGEGGMGSVYLAHDTELDRQVAVKVPKFTGDEDPQLVERFYREARAAARLQHRNICPVYDVGEIDGVRYISMAYIEGRPLLSYIRADRTQPERSVVLVVGRLARALQEAHALGIVHRDLKPGNIMIDGKRDPVIMDFGLARLDRQGESRLTQSGMILGTPAYMAPEQVSGEIDRVGPPTDIYSLGVILYELLTGRVPFEGSIAAVLGQIMTQEPSKPSESRQDLDPRLGQVCLKMMAKRIEDRYASMQEVAVALSEYLKQPDDGRLEDESEDGGMSLRTADTDDDRRLKDMFATANAIRSSDSTEAAEPPLLEQLVAVARGNLQDPTVATIAALAAALSLALLILLCAPRGPSANQQKQPPTAVAPYDPDQPRLAVAPFNAEQAKEHQRAWADYRRVPIETLNNLGMKLVLIPPGEFMMGSTAGEIARLVEYIRKREDLNRLGWGELIPSEGPQHRVRITKPFYLSVYEVTVDQFRTFVDATSYQTDASASGSEDNWTNPKYEQTDQHPVAHVSWEDAVAFYQWLSEQEDQNYLLPTEAQWEFACRAGTTTRWHFGDDATELSRYVWCGNGDKGTTAVGQKLPNAFGLFDMHGNVWEYCHDMYGSDYYGSSPVDDPDGPPSSDMRVVRGGAFSDISPLVRCAVRRAYGPRWSCPYFGFRVARTVE